MDYAIECTDVSVRFKRYQEKNRMLRWTLLQMFKESRTSETFYALKDVTFSVKPGEAFAIIGQNGSGKSTLLKILTSIVQPDSGVIRVNGKVSALLELGAGFQPDLTGRENIYLNGSILGLSRAQITDRFDDIVGFSELDAFIDTPIKHYSSGMYMRLGFSIAIHVDPDILVIDEVLAVGDQNFQHKCLDRIRDFKRRGKTIVFVSHDLATVSQLCSRAILLHEGRVVARGSTSKAIDHYHVINQENRDQRMIDEHVAVTEELQDRWGNRAIEITAVEFLDGTGQKTVCFRTGDPFRVRISYRASQRIERPVFGVAIHRNDGTHVNGPNTKISGAVPEYIEGSGAACFAIDSLPLLPGTYYFTAAVYNYACDTPFDHLDQMFPFSVIPGCTDEEYGVFYIPSTWSYEGMHGKLLPK